MLAKQIQKTGTCTRCPPAHLSRTLPKFATERQPRTGLEAKAKLARSPLTKAPGTLTFLLLTLALPMLTQAAPYISTLTGEQFVGMVNSSRPRTSANYMDRDKAYSYLDGVRDSAEGQVWCDVNQLKTHDLAQELAGAISKLPSEERKRNASKLLLEQLKRKYPCAKGGRP